MIIEPRNSQCATVQKLGLNVEKLEQVTNESMKNWFKENPDNAAKKIYLKEIFRVARVEERYRNGEVGTGAIRVSFFCASTADILW
jgi:elongation factor P--beta-lysine ligase